MFGVREIDDQVINRIQYWKAEVHVENGKVDTVLEWVS